MGTKLENLKKDKTKLLTLGVFVTDVVILIIVLIILWVMPEPRTPGEECGYMCLPCPKSESQVCCGCRAERLNMYLEENFDKSYAEVDTEYTKIYNTRIAKIYGGYIGDVKPVAHMIGEMREPSEDMKTHPVTKWYLGNNCLLLNGMSMHSGRMRVPATGYYHVYSMLDISYHYEKDNSRQSVAPTEKSSLVHSIFLSNIDNNEEIEVLSTCHPYEFSRNDIFGRFDTYLSSDIHLTAGDEVYVKVSNISQVNSPPKNIFGIYMI